MFDYPTGERLERCGSIIAYLDSLEKGFLEEARKRQDVWDYVIYKESLVKWPAANSEGNGYSYSQKSL